MISQRLATATRSMHPPAARNGSAGGATARLAGRCGRSEQQRGPVVFDRRVRVKQLRHGVVAPIDALEPDQDHHGRGLLPRLRGPRLLPRTFHCCDEKLEKRERSSDAHPTQSVVLPAPGCLLSRPIRVPGGLLHELPGYHTGHFMCTPDIVIQYDTGVWELG